MLTCKHAVYLSASLSIVFCLLATTCHAEIIGPFNGDFERPVRNANLPPSGWVTLPQMPSYIAVTGDEPASGSQCLRLTDLNLNGVATGVRSWLYPAHAGQEFTSSCKIFNESGDGWIYVEFWQDQFNRLQEFHQGGATTGSWQDIQVTGIAPEGTQYVSVTLYLSTANAGISRFDDVKLTGPVVAGDPVMLDRLYLPLGLNPEDEMIDLGSRLELFVDDFLLETMQGTSLFLHTPQRQENVFNFDAPWEGSTSAYSSISKTDTGFRLYYRGSEHDFVTEEATHPELTACAESVDGIHWTRPVVGAYEYEGSRDNSIVVMNEDAGVTHNFTPFLDTNPNCKPEEKYKAVGGGSPAWGQKGLIPYTSPDGYHWTRVQDEGMITDGAFDSQNLVFFDNLRNQYVAYYRDFQNGCRDIKVAFSDDFLHWTPGQWLNWGEAPTENLYTNAVQPYFRAPHIYMGFPKRFMESRHAVLEHPYNGVSDAVYMTSRDQLNFKRWPQALVRPGLDRNNWTERSMMTTAGMIQTTPDEISIYLIENMRHPTCHLRRYSLRLDGFVSLKAGGSFGEVTTRPFTFTGEQLVLNYATSAAGSIQVEIQDEDCRPINGYTLADCPIIYGDHIERTVTWTQGEDVSALQGKPIRLRFVMKDADIWSMQFR